MTLGEPCARHVFADGTEIHTATITLRNNARREFALRFDAIDLREMERVIAIERVTLGQDVLILNLEVRVNPPAGENLKGQTILSITGVDGSPSSRAVPFVVNRCSAEDGKELAASICGTRESLRVSLFDGRQLQPSGRSTCSLNGSGTDFVAELQTIDPRQAGAVMVDDSRIRGIPVRDWPSPVITLWLRVDSDSPE